MAGCNYDELAKGPNSNNSNNNNNSNSNSNNNNNNNNNSSNNNNNKNNNINNNNSNNNSTNNNSNSNNNNNNDSNNNNSNNSNSSQICFRVGSGRDFTVGFEPSQTLCDILSRTIYDSKNFWITHDGKELLWYFPLSEQICPTGKYIECRIHARSPKGRKYYDNSCSDVGFESLCDSDSSIFSDAQNGCLDCQNEDFSACATYGCFDNSPFNTQRNKRLIYDDPTNPLYQKRLYKREYQRKRYASMSLTARQLRLEQMRAYERARRASETLAEREARLMRLRINQKRRLDNESEADRLRRLQRLQRNQRLRLEIETPEERQKRLIRLRDNARLRIERKKAIAQILGMTRRGRHKSTTAEMLMKQADSMSDNEEGFSCMKLSQKNSSQRDGGYQCMESGNKNIANRQDGYSYMNQSEKGINNREDGFSCLNQNDKGVRREDFYLDPSQKGVADRDGNYYMKSQGENKDNSERRSGFPCMGQIQNKDGSDRARLGRNTFPCMSTSGDKGFESSENGAFSGLNQVQDKNDRELNFSCLTQDQSKDGDRTVGFPCLSQDSGKNVPSERDGAFSYSLGLGERDGGFPYLKPNYKPTQVDCVRSETMTPRSEDLLNLDAIQGSMMGNDKRMSKGLSSTTNASSNMSLLNIDNQQKNINSSCPYSGIDSEKGVKKKRKKPMYSMTDEQGEYSRLVTKTDMNDVKKGEMGLTKKGPESSRGPSLSAIIQQGCCAHFKPGTKRSMPPPNLNCCIPDLNEYGAEMMSARDRKLLKMRLKQRWRMHNETDVQRGKRLLRMKRYQRQRMKDETTEQRQARLTRMRENSKRRAQSKRALSQLLKTNQMARKRSSPTEMCMKHSKENFSQKKYQYLPNMDGSFSPNASQRERGASYMDSSDNKNTSERQEMFQYLNMNEKTVGGDQDDGFSYLNLGGGEKTGRQDDFSYLDPRQKNSNERDAGFSCMKSNSSQGQPKENPEKGSVFPCMDQGYNKDVPERGCVFPGMDQSSNQDGINRGGSTADGASFPGLNHNQEERDPGYQCLTPTPDKEQANRGSESFHYLNLNNNIDVGDKSGDFSYAKSAQRDQKRKFDFGMKKKSPDSSTGSAFASIINQDCCEQAGKDRMTNEPNNYIPQSALSRESQRQKRLEQMRQYQRRRLETETPEERLNRLQRMRDNARMRSEKKRHMSQILRNTQPVQKRLSTIDKDNMMRYQSLSDRDRESSWSCMEQNHKEKSEGFSYMSPGDKEPQDDYPYLNSNHKSISDRDDDYSFMKPNMSQGQMKDNPERGSVFPCMDHVQNKNSPERGGVFPCMEEANNKDIIERGRTGGPVFPCMTPSLNKETPDKGNGVFSCMGQDKNKRTLDRPGSVSNMNQNQTPTTTPTPPNPNNQPQSKDSTLDNRGATFPQYMIQSQGKDVIDRSISSSNNGSSSGPTMSGGSGMMFPFLNNSQNRNIPDREMGGYPCSLTPDQNSRVGNFSYPNMCHNLGITERDGSYSYIKQTPDMRKKYAESAHRKKGSEMMMGSAFASINKTDGGAGNTMAGYPKAEQNYMCASCERPLPKDQLSRFTPFPISIMGGSGADKICDDSKQWICKTCEKLKRNYHLFPNPVS